jgi:hypothetical protein
MSAGFPTARCSRDVVLPMGLAMVAGRIDARARMVMMDFILKWVEKNF